MMMMADLTWIIYGPGWLLMLKNALIKSMVAAIFL